MTVSLEHVALECDTKEHAALLYETLFGCSVLKTFSLPKEFTKQVFSINKAIDVIVYQSTNGIFEVFITENKKQKHDYYHVCIGVKNIDEFTNRCKAIGIVPFIRAKGEKQYVFIQDMVGNLFEIKLKL